MKFKRTVGRVFGLIFLILGTTVSAEEFDLSPQQFDVLDCVARMEVQTTWDQCRALLFEPCATATVGDEAHLICLNGLRDGWADQMQARFSAISARVNTSDGVALDELLTKWQSYVSLKCTDVGLAKAHISRDAATLGCEASETIGLVAELDACLDGRSIAPYCNLKEE